MADITITPANVLPSASSVVYTGTFGETVLAGQSIYLKSSDGRLYKAQNTTAEKAAAVGIALNGGSAGQPATYTSKNPLTIGGTLTVGSAYIVSATAGGIAPITDLASGGYLTILGGGNDSATLGLLINVSGAQKP